MSSVKHITDSDFENQVTQSDVPVLVDFWAPWCGPCRSFAPTYEKVSEDHPDVVFAKVNTEDEQEIAGHFQIRSIPTLMIFRDKIIIFSEAGALPESGFREGKGLTFFSHLPVLKEELTLRYLDGRTKAIPDPENQQVLLKKSPEHVA